VLLGADTTVITVGASFALQALEVGEGAGVQLQGEDFRVEALGAEAETVLPDLDASHNKEQRGNGGDGGPAEDGAKGHGVGEIVARLKRLRAKRP